MLVWAPLLPVNVLLTIPSWFENVLTRLWATRPSLKPFLPLSIWTLQFSLCSLQVNRFPHTVLILRRIIKTLLPNKVCYLLLVCRATPTIMVRARTRGLPLWSTLR